jgi:Ni,Fe-hydrogenase III large subunit
MIDAQIRCDGDILISATIKKGSQERPLWRRMERLMPNEMLVWIDRFDSLCPIASEWALAQALENSMGLRLPERIQFVRTMLCELNRLVWLTTYLGRLTHTLGQKTLTQQVYVLREHVFVMQEELTGGRILPQALCLGGCRRDFAMGDVQKMKRFLDQWKSSWMQWLDLVIGDPLLEARLSGLLTVDPLLIEKLGWWGIVGKASGVAYDARKLRPHGAYAHLDFKIPRRENGDSRCRFEVAIEEVDLTINLLEQLMKRIPNSTETRVPVKELQPGFFYGWAESAKGPVISAVEVISGGQVTSLRLFATGQRIWPVVDHLFHDFRAEDFQLAFTSLGVDSEESEI